MAALKGKPTIGDDINKKIIAPLARANPQLSQTDFADFNDANKLGSGKEMVDRLTNLIAIFENRALDFSKNRADGDDLLGDACEFRGDQLALTSNPRRKAPATIRRQIVEALRDPARRFLDPKSSSRNYLDQWDLKAKGFYVDLADGLEASENLFLKPKNHPNDPQR